MKIRIFLHFVHGKDCFCQNSSMQREMFRIHLLVHVYVIYAPSCMYALVYFFSSYTQCLSSLSVITVALQACLPSLTWPDPTPSRVWPRETIAYLQQVKLHSTLNGNDLVDSLPIRFGLKCTVLHGGLGVVHPPQEGEASHLGREGRAS